MTKLPGLGLRQLQFDMRTHFALFKLCQHDLKLTCASISNGLLALQRKLNVGILKGLVHGFCPFLHRQQRIQLPRPLMIVNPGKPSAPSSPQRPSKRHEMR